MDLCSFLIEILAFELGKLCPGVAPGGGEFFVFRPGGRSFALKSCPGAGILTEKISGPGGGW